MDRVALPGSWTTRGRRRWALPVVLVAAFPLSLLVVGLVAAVLGGWITVRDAGPLTRLRSAPAFGLGARIVWLSIATVGLVALVNDVEALS